MLCTTNGHKWFLIVCFEVGELERTHIYDAGYSADIRLQRSNPAGR